MFRFIVSCVLLRSAMVDSALPLPRNDSCSQQSPDGDEVFPVWFVCGSNNTCVCGSSEHRIVKCSQDSQVAMVWTATVSLMMKTQGKHLLVHASSTVAIGLIRHTSMTKFTCRLKRTHPN